VDFARNLQWTRKYTIQLEETRTEIGKTEESLNDLTGQFIYGAMGAELGEEGALNLARALGILDEAAWISQLVMLSWKDQLGDNVLTIETAIEKLEELQGLIEGGATPGEIAGLEWSPPQSEVMRFRAPFGGKRQHGGGVQEGVGYVVGELGPEWFEPDTAGKIYPLGSLAKGEKHGKFGGTLSGSLETVSDSISQISGQQATMQGAIRAQGVLMGDITRQQSQDMGIMTRGQQAGNAELADRLDRLIELTEAMPRKIARSQTGARARYGG
jgi:hypothetical protein